MSEIKENVQAKQAETVSVKVETTPAPTVKVETPKVEVKQVVEAPKVETKVEVQPVKVEQPKNRLIDGAVDALNKKLDFRVD